MSTIHTTYDLPSRPYHEKVAKLICKYVKKGGVILDIGCGTGQTLKYLSDMEDSYKILAADIDGECLKITNERVELVKAIKIDDIGDLYNKGERFDGIILSHVLEHLQAPIDTLSNLIKMLNFGGVLVVAVPNPVRWQVMFFNLLRMKVVNRGHVYSWDRSHWMNFLENIAKVNVTEYSEDYFALPFSDTFRFLRPLEKALARVFPWFSFSNIAVIQKR